jgi:hypothetical protein
MDCPRCGARLSRISLNGELQSVYCERCRFADVESDHTRASAGEETWDDALRRFRTANAGGESAGNADPGAASDADGDDSDDTHAGDPGTDGESDAADAAPDEAEEA